MRVERFAERPRGTLALPVSGCDVVHHHIAGDDVQRALRSDVSAAFADDHTQFRLVIQSIGHSWLLNWIVRAVDTRHLLVEPQLALRRLAAASEYLLEVVLIVQTDGQELRRIRNRRRQLYFTEPQLARAAQVRVLQLFYQRRSGTQHIQHRGTSSGQCGAQVEHVVTLNSADGHGGLILISRQFHIVCISD